MYTHPEDGWYRNEWIPGNFVLTGNPVIPFTRIGSDFPYPVSGRAGLPVPILFSAAFPKGFGEPGRLVLQTGILEEQIRQPVEVDSDLGRDRSGA